MSANPSSDAHVAQLRDEQTKNEPADSPLEVEKRDQGVCLRGLSASVILLLDRLRTTKVEVGIDYRFLSAYGRWHRQAWQEGISMTF